MDQDGWSFAPGGTPRQVREAAGAEPRHAPPPPPPPRAVPAAPAPRTTPAPQPQVIYPHPVPMAQPTNGMATASLVLGIIGMFLPILAILALVFGSIGISKANQGASGKGMAIAGLILGILGTLVLLYMLGEST